jgi:hypothetical protein
MKLRIATDISSLASQDPLEASQIGKLNCRSLIDFIMQRQEMSNWCWAAIAASIGDYFQTSHLNQREIASQILDFSCAAFREDTSLASRCNQSAMLDDALRLVKGYSHWSPGRPAFKQVQAAIDRGCPVCPCIEWHRGGFHYVVIIGYAADTNEVYVEDSLHGPSVQRFAQFPKTYRATGGGWHGTFWTDCCAETNLSQQGIDFTPE